MRPGPSVGATLRCHRDAAVVARTAALLGPHVDHLVIAAEERMSRAELELLAGIEGAELIRLPVCEPNNRTVQFLHEHCETDWHLLLDGDEIPSRALLGRLRALCAAPGITHVRLRMRWLWPDTGSELVARPWSNDWHTRLVRTGPGLVLNEGAPHSATTVVGPGIWIDDAPVFHAALLLEDQDARVRKVQRYNARGETPTFAFGLGFNEAFYLPERRSQAPARRPLEDVDSELLDAVLYGPAPPLRRPLGELPPVVPLEAIDSRWPRRPLALDALHAEIEVLDPDTSFVGGERRWITIAVTNRGSERWPWGDHGVPTVRVSYRWELQDGRPDPGDRASAALPAPVAPGERAVMIVMVTAPEDPGRHRLELALVGDGGTWGPPAARLAIDVAPAASAP